MNHRGLTNKDIGNRAEDRAAKYLIDNGFKVIDRNWKNRRCEIDVIAQKNQVIYFVEVKSRLRENFGSGLDYITPKKLSQMVFATKFWLNSNNWAGQIRLAVISIDEGKITFIDDIYS